ncbi:MAG: hypothetical protein C0614_05715 [Desulfuromonas sp.]|nr:MAG: hypothetical protein C0614_05715 [Desulfuromonas sp.]
MVRMRGVWLKSLLGGLFIGVALLAASISSAMEGDTAEVTFTISSYQVSGSSLFEQELLERWLEPFTGEEKSFATIQQAIELLESNYWSQGFKTVAVILPEQRLNEGVVRLDVVEPRLSSVVVSGNRYFDQSNILTSLPHL